MEGEQLHQFIRSHRHALALDARDAFALSLYVIVGVLAGGRAIEVFFDEWRFYIAHPSFVPRYWLGGMATHRLLIGAGLGAALFAVWYRRSFLRVADVLVIPGAFLMGVGRLGNFIDGTIVGRPTDVWWAVQFPYAEGLRHPVVLYDGMKNLALVPYLLHVYRTNPTPGATARRSAQPICGRFPPSRPFHRQRQTGPCKSNRSVRVCGAYRESSKRIRRRKWVSQPGKTPSPQRQLPGIRCQPESQRQEPRPRKDCYRRGPQERPAVRRLLEPAARPRAWRYVMKRDKVRILVVDDEEIVRESLLAWLSRDGYHVETAPDGASALDRLGEAEPWTLLLVDLKMPGGHPLGVVEAGDGEVSSKQARARCALVEHHDLAGGLLVRDRLRGDVPDPVAVAVLRIAGIGVGPVPVAVVHRMHRVVGVLVRHRDGDERVPFVEVGGRELDVRALRVRACSAVRRVLVELELAPFDDHVVDGQAEARKGLTPRGAFLGVEAHGALEVLAGIAVDVLEGREPHVGPVHLLHVHVPDRARIWRLFRIGVPAGAEGLGFQVGFIGFIWIIARYGNEANAAYQLGVNLLAFSFLVGQAFSIAASTLVGQHLRAGDEEGAERSGWRAMSLAIGVMVVFGGIIIGFAEPLARYLSPSDPEVVRLTVAFIWVLGSVQALMAIEFTLGGALRGAGDTMFPFVTVLSGLGFGRLAFAALFMSLGKSIEWVYAALIADYIIKGVLFVSRFRQRALEDHARRARGGARAGRRTRDRGGLIPLVPLRRLHDDALLVQASGRQSGSKLCLQAISRI